MKGHSEVIDCLNGLLTKELTAIDQYLVQAAMLHNWGYHQLHDRIAHEAEDETGHVKKLIDRVLYLDGVPNVASRAPLNIGSGPKEMIESDLALEVEVAKLLNDGMATCRDKGDNGTRALLEELLNDTETDHILWFETQLRLIDQVGLKNYLSEKL